MAGQVRASGRGATARRLLGRADFRRLLLTRLASQFGDGVFQAALAGTVLFNPQRAADPVDVAAGFAILLVPYSLVGPFAGVWLDRWSRRQVLVVANCVRAGLVGLVAALTWWGVSGPLFYLAGLAVFSVNRFVLSALSAGLPHTCDRPQLVPANALTTTAGAVSGVLGGGVAIGVQSLLGGTDGGYALLALCSAPAYLLGAAVVSGFARPHLGPDHTSRAATVSARDVLHGMVAGARHVLASRAATWVLGVMAVQRVCFGLLTLLTLLLYRNSLQPVGWFPVGLPGLAQVLAAGALGTLLAAAATPPAVRRWGKNRWTTAVLLLGAVGQLGLGLPFSPPTIVAAGFVLGFVGQAVKICVDSTLQEVVHDDFRGRVFSVYDTLFNVTFVAAVVVAALLLPSSGTSVPALVVVAVLYLTAAIANGVAGLGGRSSATPSEAQGPA
ncbi:Major Facilitator Superfamily protein [Klenkia soli]|uniref:Major Facilitator Superfamily protein n=1 Tax=Klenkia soli TaxID=1052260 RepID=A0A1H0RE89_9ACTN|nr:MFS transporter [Klenkia soli]SDP27499.1 Major Facilitator Superfamily protein [Klenkia soli]